MCRHLDPFAFTFISFNGGDTDRFNVLKQSVEYSNGGTVPEETMQDTTNVFIDFSKFVRINLCSTKDRLPVIKKCFRQRCHFLNQLIVDPVAAAAEGPGLNNNNNQRQQHQQ